MFFVAKTFFFLICLILFHFSEFFDQMIRSVKLRKSNVRFFLIKLEFKLSGQSEFNHMACDLRLGERTAQMYVSTDITSFGHVTHKSEHIKNT